MKLVFVIAGLILNSADAILTFLAITNGASEANPIMAMLISLGMPQFLLFKLLFVNLIIISLANFEQYNKLTLKLLMFAGACYACTIVYHFINLHTLWL